MKTYTPQRFVEENLPSYEKRWSDFQECASRVLIGASRATFCNHHFSEALSAYSRKLWDKACEEQREICASEAGETQSYDAGLFYRIVLSAPSPKFNLEEK